MAKKDLTEALNDIQLTYEQVIEIANDIVKPYVVEVDKLIKDAVEGVNNLSNDDIRLLIINLSLKSYSFSEVKEKAGLKAECAETLRKEAYAIAYNGAEGAVAARDNAAIIGTSDRVVAESVYNLVSSLFKTKLDEIHRVIDSLKTVLMSRMAEAKLSAGLTSVGE